MLLRVPDYYERFHCIASACPDNCCIGWEIDIDPDSDRRYQQVAGPFGERLRRSIHRDREQPCFRMEGERCAMLNDDKLCELILCLGEESLCQICRDHPRFTDTFGTLRETGVGLCCPEAGRLLLSNPEPMDFLLLEIPETPETEECDPELLRFLLEEREELFRIAQDRACSIPERMDRLLEYGMRLQIKLEQEDSVPESDPAPVDESVAVSEVGKWLEALSGLEAINQTWTATLEGTIQCFACPSEEWENLRIRFRREAVRWEYEYENLLMYYLFRYFLKAVYTGDCLTPVQLAVVSTLLTGALELAEFSKWGAIPADRRIALAGLYSKQVEYSEENLETLKDWLIFDTAFSCEKIRLILNAF